VTDAAGTMREMLRGLPVFPDRLPEFDVRAAPGDPVTLFLSWLGEAVRDGVLGPHAMTLATADATGRVSSRVLICKDVDEGGRWYFASDSASVKGRDLAVNPRASRDARSASAAGPPQPAAPPARRTSWPGRPPPGPRRWPARSRSRSRTRPSSTRRSAGPRPKSTRTRPWSPPAGRCTR
jgi:hypothetical protein